MRPLSKQEQWDDARWADAVAWLVRFLAAVAAAVVLTFTIMNTNEARDGLEMELTRRQTAAMWACMASAAICAAIILGFAVKGFADWLAGK
jgi:hypothetical protein